jgi:cobalt-precorrin 5A hydrolase
MADPAHADGHEGASALIIAITRAGISLAGSLAERLNSDTSILVPARFRDLLAATAQVRVQTYEGSLSARMSELFRSHQSLIFIAAVGVAVRLIAPYLQSKRTDPAVLAIDEGGRFVIPVCSGHLGGANALAERVAALIGAMPVITTASDVQGTIAVDLLGRELGWRVEASPSDLLRAAAAVVNGEPVVVVDENGRRDWWPADRPLPANLRCVPSLDAAGEASAFLWITRRTIEQATLARLGAPVILYHPPESTS